MGVSTVLGVVTNKPGVMLEERTIEPHSPISAILGYTKQQSSTQINDNTLFDIVDEISLKTKQRRCGQSSKPTNKWSRAEIDTLLKLINIYGTDFSLVALRMHKTRDQIKRKYTIL